VSGPVTHDPLVVNTKDGVCWERRAVTSDGRGLYAVEGSCKCPPFKMATLAELAEHGIVGAADVLPVPVGSGPRTLGVVENELTGANLALYEEELDNARLRLALESARRGRRELRARVAELEAAEQRRVDTLKRCRVDAAEQAKREADPARRAAWRMLAEDSLEDPHDSPLHHPYRVGRELPETGSASC
jgi:hypothetical protein